MKNLNEDKGISLIAAIIIMLVIAVLSASLVSMLGTTSRGSIDYLRSAQAFALTQAGLNWYMMRLAELANWSTETNQTGISLGPGTFDVVVSNIASPETDSNTATRLDFTVTGKIAGSDGQTIQRTMSQRAWKLPSASKFALFWGTDTGATLTLTNSTINGDMWSAGNATFSGSSMTEGLAYYPSDKSITGISDIKAITNPLPSMPTIDLTYYADLATNYANLTNICQSNSTINQNTDLVLNGNMVCCRNFNTNTNPNTSVTISGHGYIVAKQNIQLNTSGFNGRTLNIQPSGGNIVFVAARAIAINATSGTSAVTGASGIRMFSLGSNNAYIIINNNNTNIDGALIMGNRGLLVRNSAHLTNSTLLVAYPGNKNNNFLQITGAGTTVGTPASPCSVLSTARTSGLQSALTVAAGASVVGFLYQYDKVGSGETRLDSASIIGTIIANKLNSDSIGSSTITYDPQAIPDPPPEGFDGFVTKDPNSWSGN